MPKPTGYESKTHLVQQRGREIEVENRIPALTDTERSQCKKQIEERLYDIFSEYRDV